MAFEPTAADRASDLEFNLRMAQAQLETAQKREAALVKCLTGYQAIYFFAERCPHCYGMPQRFCQKHARLLTELYQEITTPPPQAEQAPPEKGD